VRPSYGFPKIAEPLGQNVSKVLPVTLGCRVSDCQQQIAAQHKQHLPKIYSRWHKCSLVFGKDASDLSNFRDLRNLKKKMEFHIENARLNFAFGRLLLGDNTSGRAVMLRPSGSSVLGLVFQLHCLA
jgi:hypothetical protein